MEPGDVFNATWEFPGELFEWRGPAPYHFIGLPQEVAEVIRSVASVLSYGWGVIPVKVRIGESEWTTSLFPKEGTYLVPIKDRIRHAEDLVIGDVVPVELFIGS